MGQGVPTLDEGTYPGWGVPALDGGVVILAGGYLPWTMVPNLDGEGTYCRLGGTYQR